MREIVPERRDRRNQTLSYQAYFATLGQAAVVTPD
jgi:hypothetical protein